MQHTIKPPLITIPTASDEYFSTSARLPDSFNYGHQKIDEPYKIDKSGFTKHIEFPLYFIYP